MCIYNYIHTYIYTCIYDYIILYLCTYPYIIRISYTHTNNSMYAVDLQTYAHNTTDNEWAIHAPTVIQLLIQNQQTGSGNLVQNRIKY